MNIISFLANIVVILFIMNGPDDPTASTIRINDYDSNEPIDSSTTTHDGASHHLTDPTIIDNHNIPDDPTNTTITNDAGVSNKLVMDHLIPPDFKRKMEEVRDLPYDHATEQLFPVHSFYESKEQLKSMLILFGGTKGFHISTSGYKF